MKHLIAALDYAAAGWRVFPVNPENKHPRVGKGGYKHATTDPDQIIAWWSAHPDDGIAVACRLSGFVAIDVDPRNGGDLAPLEEVLGHLPRSAVQRTKSGGLHVLFADPAPGPEGWTRTHDEGGCARGQLGQGIDFKHNGYILVHPTPGYEWVTPAPWTRPLPALPFTWQEHGRKDSDDITGHGAGVEAWERASHHTPFRDADRLRSALGQLQRGQGASATFRAIATVFHDFGLSIEEGMPFLKEWNATCGKPMDGHELSRQIQRIAAKALEGLRGGSRSNVDPLDIIVGASCYGGSVPPVSVLTLDELAPDDQIEEEVVHVDTFDGDLSDLVDAPAPSALEPFLKRTAEEVTKALPSLNATRQPRRVPMFTDYGEFADRAFPPESWALQGVLPAEGVCILLAPPKLGKSWLMGYMAAALAAGREAFGKRVPRRRRVWYFFAEDGGASIQQRIAAIRAGHNIGRDQLVDWLKIQEKGEFIDVCDNLSLVELIASVRARAAEAGNPDTSGDVVVLDPLRDIHSADENDNTAMAAVMRRLRLIQTLLGGLVIVPAHPKKNAPGHELDDIRGAGAVGGAVDGTVLITGTRNAKQCDMTLTPIVRGMAPDEAFRVRRTIEDNAENKAVKATFEVLAPEAEEVDPLVEEGVYALLEKLWWVHEERGDDGLSTAEALKVIGHGKHHGYSVIEEAQQRGWVMRPDGKPGARRGLRLSALGRAEISPIVKGVKP